MQIIFIVLYEFFNDLTWDEPSLSRHKSMTFQRKHSLNFKFKKKIQQDWNKV